MAVGPRKFSWMIFLVFRYFWRKKFFFPTPPFLVLPYRGEGGIRIFFGGGGYFRQIKTKLFIAYFYAIPQLLAKKRGSQNFFFSQKLQDSINISYEKFRFYPTSLTPQNADSPLPPVRQHQQGGSKKNFFFAKSSGISKNSSMRIFVVLRPNLISQSTA